ncbi:MAG: hypothetical protein RLZZ117_2609 [Cyanobacteriota bacterium]|jgi:ribulose-5-phosphate 4-epimerase/fuculose-1-phosphate aldolase
MTLPMTTSQDPLVEAQALCQVIRDIHRRGWCDGTGGNFSSMLSAQPLSVLMAPSGVDKGSLQPEELIVVDGAGQVISGQGRASAETLLHLRILTATKARAVLHTHSQAATLLSRFPDTTMAEERSMGLAESPQNNRHSVDDGPSGAGPNSEGATPDAGSAGREAVPIAPLGRQDDPHRPARPLQGPEVGQLEPDEANQMPALLGHVQLKGLEMLKGLEGIRSHNGSIAIPILANSQDLQLLSQAAAPLLANAPHGLLIAGHGLYAWGESLFQAKRHLEILEFLLEQHWRERLFRALQHASVHGEITP